MSSLKLERTFPDVIEVTYIGQQICTIIISDGKWKLAVDDISYEFSSEELIMLGKYLEYLNALH